ncbi:hypothetical protein DPMN_096575 [Dreissena polymorpha]|uniref:Uncharacterized protein n=1 Tax=Dreissena polymorpha TaxID=45954 RepID=A0A9D4LBL7_DREPO|nr:hypothetical protein DPMN_096575 [Dreissena polymorpha]
MVQSNISNGISVGGTTVPTRNINNYNSGDDTSNVTNQAGKASRPNAHVDTRKTYTSEVLKNKKQITVPTMAEIASQYEPEHYNKFSRKVPPGAKDVASYGEKKNIGYSNGMIATSVQKTKPRASDVKTNIDVTNQKKSRLTGGKDEIIDERIAFERKIQKENQKPAGYARAQEAKFYKDPSYYLKKRTSISPTQWDMSKTDIQFERPQRHGKGVHSSVTSIDGNKRSRRPSLVDKVTSRSADFTGSVTNRSGMTTRISFYRRGVSLGQQNRKETTAVVHGEKMYHSLWRKAFSNALEKMKENKVLFISFNLIIERQVIKTVKTL